MNALTAIGQPQLDTAAPACTAALQMESGDTSGTAPNMNQRPAAVGLQRRAMRLYPHKRLARARYLSMHHLLGKGASYEGR